MGKGKDARQEYGGDALLEEPSWKCWTWWGDYFGEILENWTH